MHSISDIELSGSYLSCYSLSRVILISTTSRLPCLGYLRFLKVPQSSLKLPKSITIFVSMSPIPIQHQHLWRLFLIISENPLLVKIFLEPRFVVVNHCVMIRTD